MKNIEEILLLNNYISDWNLVFNKFEIKTKFLFFLICIPFITLFIMFVIRLFSKPEIKFLWPIVPTFFLMIALVAFYNYHSKKVIKKHYPYVLKNKTKRKRKTMLEIRKKELKKRIGNKRLFEKENLLFIIESVKYHTQREYNYLLLWNAVIILSSVFLGTIITILTEEYRSKIGTGQFLTNLSISVGLIVFCILYVDHYLIKDFLQLKRKNKKRLIRTLENIYLEKYAK